MRPMASAKLEDDFKIDQAPMRPIRPTLAASLDMGGGNGTIVQKMIGADDHLDQADETIAQRLHPVARRESLEGRVRRAQRADYPAENDADEHLDVKNRCGRDGAVAWAFLNSGPLLSGSARAAAVRAVTTTKRADGLPAASRLSQIFRI